jgi:hypothetical protein
LEVHSPEPARSFAGPRRHQVGELMKSRSSRIANAKPS